MTTKRSREEVIAAINDTAAIKTVIARKLGVTRKTFDAYLKKWVTVREAYEQEREVILDVAESVVVRNIQTAYQMSVHNNEIVNTQDARWLLSRGGKNRGYGNGS